MNQQDYLPRAARREADMPIYDDNDEPFLFPIFFFL